MIRVVCLCGKSLKAPAKLAGRKCRCPACGATVTVPLAVAAPTDSSQEYSLAEPAPQQSAWTPTVFPQVDPNHTRHAHYERHPFDVCWDTLQGAKFVLLLSLGLAILTAFGVELYPHVLDEGVHWMSGLSLFIVWSGAVAVAVAYGCHFLAGIQAHVVDEGTRRFPMPECDPGPALTTLAKWFCSFAAGPAFLFGMAVHYWISCGDVDVIDGLILVELALPAAGYWIMAVLVQNTHPDLIWVRPHQVLKMARRLGWRALWAGLGFTALAFIHLLLAAWSIMLWHEASLPALLSLWLCWLSAWICAAIGFNILGSWHIRSRKPAGPACSPGSGITAPLHS